MGLPDGSVRKESTWNEGDTGNVGSISGSERSPGRRNDNPFQYFSLENPMVRGVWQATVQRAAKRGTQLGN